MSLCALFDDKRVFISEQNGGVIPRGDFPWRWTLCGWSLAFKNPQILIIPDTQLDSRFAHNLKVTQPPHVRFYAGAPLIASIGHRLGTLCFADVKPRQFDAASCVVINNLSELVVRQLEKKIALKLKSKEHEDIAAAYRHVQRSLDAFDHCVLLLDTTAKEGWKIIYSNASLGKMTGLDRDSCVGCPIEEIFEDGEGRALVAGKLKEAVEKNMAFKVPVARLNKSRGGNTASAFTLHFRPGDKLAFDDGGMPIGVPAFLPVRGGESEGQRLFFVTVDLAGHATPKSTHSSVSLINSNYSSLLSSSSECDGLELGHLLGKGTFGSVYYGTWFGSPVAVKVIDSEVKEDGGKDMLEAVISAGLKHPGVITTLKYFTRGPGSADGSRITSYEDHVSQSLGSVDSSYSLSSNKEVSGANAAAHVNNSSSSNATAVINFADSESFGEECSMTPDSCMMTPSSAVKAVKAVTGEGFKEKLWQQIFIVMEYADRGSLQEAVDRGWLLKDRSNIELGSNMTAVLATAVEVAGAIHFLHSSSVIHGDLSGWNVMLVSNGATANIGGRSFVAKVADFGLSRTLETGAEILTKTYGTLTHMPPETLTQGVISQATDIYSFGILLWQMFTGSRPWSGLTHAQIINQVGNQGQRLKWPSSTPTNYRDLAEACTHPDAAKRPRFDAILAALEKMQANVKDLEAASLVGEWD